MAKKKGGGGASKVSTRDTDPSQAQIDAAKPQDPVLPTAAPDPQASRDRRNAKIQIQHAEIIEHFSKGYGFHFLLLVLALFVSKAFSYDSWKVYLTAAILIGVSTLLIKGLLLMAGGPIELPRNVVAQKEKHTVGWWAGFAFCAGIWGVSVWASTSIFLPFFLITAVIAACMYIFQ